MTDSQSAAAASEQRRQQLLGDETLPAAIRQALAAGQPLERIVLDGEGGWHYQGDPIENPKVAALFHRSIERTPGGTYVLHIAPFSYPIEVVDAPYQVRRLALPATTPPTVELELSDGTIEQLAPQTLRQRAGRGLYAEVKARKPGGPFLAHFGRTAYYALAELIVDKDGRDYLLLGADHYAIDDA
jgi:hypothetical protein